MADFKDYAAVKKVITAAVKKARSKTAQWAFSQMLLRTLRGTSVGDGGHWAPELDGITASFIPELYDLYCNLQNVTNLNNKETLLRLSIIATAGLNYTVPGDSELSEKILYATGCCSAQEIKNGSLDVDGFHSLVRSSEYLHNGIRTAFDRYANGINARRARMFRVWLLGRSGIRYGDKWLYKDAAGENNPEFRDIADFMVENIFPGSGHPRLPCNIKDKYQILAEYLRHWVMYSIFCENDTDPLYSLELFWRSSGMGLHNNPFSKHKLDATYYSLTSWRKTKAVGGRVDPDMAVPAVWLSEFSTVFYGDAKGLSDTAEDIIGWIRKEKKK